MGLHFVINNVWMTEEHSVVFSFKKNNLYFYKKISFDVTKATAVLIHNQAASSKQLNCNQLEIVCFKENHYQ